MITAACAHVNLDVLSSFCARKCVESKRGPRWLSGGELFLWQDLSVSLHVAQHEPSCDVSGNELASKGNSCSFRNKW